MASESVLIVDDAPVNLKLADIVLRREGFQVHTARGAEEALTLLRDFQPDMMLVEANLPGMTGMELARCVKMDPLTREIVVVAFTDSAGGASAAGCDGAIAKPVDMQALGGKVRAYLEHRNSNGEPGAEPGFAPAWLGLTETELEGLRRRFLSEGIRQTHHMLESLGPSLDVALANRLLRRWMSAAVAMGYPRIEAAAHVVLEMLALARPNLTTLREAATELLGCFSEPPEAAPDSLPEAVLKTLSGKRVALAGFNAEDEERLCSALDRAGARPRLFAANESPDYGPVRDCGLVLVEVNQETLNSSWLAVDSPVRPGQPVILAGARKFVLQVDVSVRSRAVDYLFDGWQIEEALLRCCLALEHPEAPAAPAAAISAVAAARVVPPPRPATGPPDILIADDDPIVRSLLRGTLENYGMNCRMASNGPEALEMIHASQPDAAVLDVNMPGLDGYLVLATIREEELPIPVVLLTARCHENDIARGFTLGADDYVVKPFNNVELVARLRRLLKR
jgi:CheY-like chemotaxis protein